MKKLLIGVLGLGLGIAIGGMSLTSFANENNTNISDVDLNNTVQSNQRFRALDQESNTPEGLDGNQYDSNQTERSQNERSQYMNSQDCCNDNNR